MIFVQDWYNYSSAESTQYSTLFREGLNAWNDLTLTPRLFFCDLKENFGALPEYSPLYTGDTGYESQLEWPGKQEIVQKKGDISRFHAHLNKEETFPLAEWQNLDTEIQSWSDYSRLHYHSRSMHSIPSTSLEGGAFDTFNAGLGFAQTSSWSDSVMDEKIRFFLEECDSIDGFNVHVDTVGGFGGVCAATLDLLRDEFPRQTILTFGYEDTLEGLSDRDVHKTKLNSALAANRFLETASLYVPIQVSSLQHLASNGWSKYLAFNPSSKYQSSALIAAAVDTALFGARLQKDSWSISDTVELLKYNSPSNIAHIYSVFPMKSFEAEESHKSFLDRVATNRKVLANISGDDERIMFSQYQVYRGFSEHHMTSSMAEQSPIQQGLVKEMLGEVEKKLDKTSLFDWYHTIHRMRIELENL